MVIRRGGPEAARNGLRQLVMDAVKLGLHLAKGDEGQDRLGVLVGPERGVGPQLVRRLEEAAGEVLEVEGHLKVFPNINQQ